ncbi:hypothetical protein [Cellulosimicrobium protaetiae]|uniref:Uncharacterized protein n=1 Tax=Cellulosimicrobium protaetiae TaxID=2587808 RepID=A0A6M5UFN6_9MICO|nr:hypothetical protein [Cellulosimicrobium protaetiae]QJW36462.1 hypothetical protein FIC82_009915 [Cellulosimicrobium protaetiae]
MDAALIPDHLVRVLRYVDLIDRGGGVLSDHDIDAFASSPPPSATISMSSTEYLRTRLGFMLDRGTAQYMQDVGWLNHSITSPRLTSAGRAIVKVLAVPDAEPDQDGESVTVLSPDDALNLFSLTGAIAEARSGMLADPYFQDQLVPWLMSSTSIKRLLLCRKPKDRALLELGAGAALQDGRDLEIRCLPPTAFHDRYLLAEDDSVSMIGASLNGLHKYFTVIVPVPEPGAAAVREYLEEKWESAEVIEPKTSLSAPTEPTP